LEPQSIPQSHLPAALAELMTEAKATLEIAGTERCGYCKLSGGRLNQVLRCSVQFVAYFWFTKLSPLEDGQYGVSTVELIAVKTSGLNASAATSEMVGVLAEQNSLENTKGTETDRVNWDLETTRVRKELNHDHE